MEKQYLVINHWDKIIKDENIIIEDSQILNLLIKTEENIKDASKKQDRLRFFYRGESEDYGETRLTPSVFRGNNEKWGYFDALTHFPQEFSGLSNLSKLAKMQHYTYPTRLLDLTTNPLVALWFACSDYSRYGGASELKNKDGFFYIIAAHEDHILTHDSDKALLLACLAKLDDENEKPALTQLLYTLAKRKNDIDNLYLTNDLVKSCKSDSSLKKGLYVFEKFIGEANRERSAFVNYRTKVTDLLSTFIIRPQIENERLRKQEGIFAIFGIQATLYDNSWCYKISRFRIPKKNKKSILMELDRLGIKRSNFIW